MRYKYLTETQIEKLESLTPEEAEKIQQIYLDNDMYELKKICKTLIYKKKKSSKDLPTLHDAELESLAVEVFLSSLLKYDSSVKCTFKTFLYGNIWRKYWTYTRDIERKKRCVYVPDIDEETGKQKVDKEGNPKEKPVFDISIYSQIDEDGMQLWETFVSGKTVEDVVFQNDQEMSSTMREYTNKLSRVQSVILHMLADGFNEEEILQNLHISKSLYNDSLKAIRNNTNTRILIHKNDRICQFRIMKKQPEIHFETVKELSGKSRGGFGSTGKN